jgi:RND superfamily putative drug exporter
VAALIILLIIFGGAVLASLLPLAGTAVALVIGLCLVRLLTHAFDVASQSIDLAVLWPVRPALTTRRQRSPS